MNHPAWDLVNHIDTKDWDKERPKHTVKKQDWSREIAGIEAYLPTAVFPDHPIMIDTWLTIGDVREYLELEMQMVHANYGIATYRPYLDRVLLVVGFLQDIKKMNEMADV